MAVCLFAQIGERHTLEMMELDKFALVGGEAGETFIQCGEAAVVLLFGLAASVSASSSTVSLEKLTRERVSALRQWKTMNFAVCIAHAATVPRFGS